MGKWEKGVSGNPLGRPRGAKNKLSETFWADCLAAWEAGGKAAIDRVLAEEPAAFVRVIASLMPKETDLTIRNRPLREMTDEELAAIASGKSEEDD